MLIYYGFSCSSFFCNASVSAAVASADIAIGTCGFLRNRLDSGRVEFV